MSTRIGRNCSTGFPRDSRRSLAALSLLLAVVVVLAACSSAEPSQPSTVTEKGTRATLTVVAAAAEIQSPAVPTSTSLAATPITAAAPSATSTAVRVENTPTAAAIVTPDPSASPTEGVSATGETGTLPGATPEAETNAMRGAYQPRPGVIALDPGHGGPESGAAASGVVEKNVNLEIALKLAGLLRDVGLTPVLTRNSDRAVYAEYTGSGYRGGLGNELQARVKIANEAGAVLFISIHNNGHGDPSESGTEVWFNNSRPFSDRNLALARLVQQHLIEEIRALGHAVRDRGIKDDANFRIFRGRAYNIYVLSPGNGPRQHVPTQMPGVLGESLFVSNPTEAALLRQDRTIEAIARGYLTAIQAYLAEHEA